MRLRVLGAIMIPILDALKRLPCEYPAELLAARRIAYLRQAHELCNPLEARLAAIDTALGQSLDVETVNNLLEEKAEIMIRLECE